MISLQNNKLWLTLSGNFQARSPVDDESCQSFYPKLPLRDIPGYYNLINVECAVLTQMGLLEFASSDLNINIPMIKEAQEENNMKILLTIGGVNSDFNFLDAGDKVNNLYNSMEEHHLSWGFDGFNFDLRQLSSKNIPFVTKLIKWFREDYPKALLSLTALATDVCPDAGGITGKWNRMVPLINLVRGYIDCIQIMAYNYGNAFKQIHIKTESDSKSSHPLSPAAEKLEYIFTSFVNPFTFDNPEPGEVAGYYGFDAKKLFLGVLPVSFLGPQYYVEPKELIQVMTQLKKKHKETVGGIMISSINEDARNLYQFTKTNSF